MWNPPVCVTAWLPEEILISQKPIFDITKGEKTVIGCLSFTVVVGIA